MSAFWVEYYTLHSSCGTFFVCVIDVHLAGLLKGILNLQVLSECVSGRETLHVSEMCLLLSRHLRRILDENLNRGENVPAVSTFPV